MSYRVSELAEHLVRSGMPCVAEGDADREITDCATLEDAQPNHVSFLANPKYEAMLQTTEAGAVVVGQAQKAPSRLTVLRTPDPYAAIAVLMVRVHGFRRHPGEGVDPRAVVHDSAEIGEGTNISHGVTICAGVRIGRNVTIYPGCYVADGCRIGDNCILYPNVVLYDGCVLGQRVTIHAGSVIGEDGLGYAPIQGKWKKIPQVGTVELGDDVEIGSNCSIDRATLGRTLIGAGTKFSNLIAIGHGCKIGEDCMFVAQVGLAGSVTVGKHVTIAGKVGVAGHLKIGDNAEIAAMAGVMRDVPADTRVMGAPATDSREAGRSLTLVAKLPEMRKQIMALEKQVAELRARLDGAK